MQDEVLSFTVTKNKALKEVGIWNKLSQPCNNQEIKDITEFGRAFDVWWFNLQPAAHVKSGHLLPATDEINQRKTNKVGKGGFVLVMLMLTWQRVACGETSSEWDLAVGNVIEVLWQIRSCPLSNNHANTPCPMICFQSQGHQNMFQSTQCVYRPPEAPLKVCLDFRGFEAPKIALSLSGDRGFEASGGPKAVWV